MLTFPKVAILLKVTQNTAYSTAHTGRIPAFKIRGQARFKSDAIDRLIDQQKAGVEWNALEDFCDV
ncbi:helix-turn-helix domain-containing protein [Paracoccus sanguinis]|uniref:helix-turn-helix domain-containing protein n=1 Tax=Paracoccus sanguinis TaxID=1545044 RepID=UPI0022B0B505|nr:helix-turn-helix domain-containing protein [Paracoccus sanguinis]